MEVNSLFLIIKAKLPARVLHQKRKNWMWYLLCIGSKFTLVQFYFSFPFTREDCENEFLQMENMIWDQWHCLLHGKLQVPYWKLFGLLTQTSIFSASLRMWLNRRKAFFKHCSPRSISFKDTTIVRNFYPKKFHLWYSKSKKVSKDLPPAWWEFANDYTSDHRKVHNL